MLYFAAGLALLIAIGAILIGFNSGRRGQRAQYYAIRRAAQDVADRRMAFGFWSLVFAGLLYGLSFVLPQDPAASEAAPPALSTAAPALAQAEPTAQTAPPTVTVAPTQIATPTAAPSPTPAATATAEANQPTPTLAVTATNAKPGAKPSATASASTSANLGTPFAPSASQALALRAIGIGWGKSGELQGVANEFTTGTKTITVFFNFQDVPKGTLLRHSWLKNGKTLSFSSATFTKPGKGTDAISWSPKSGFEPGLYEVRVALGNAQQFVANFLVR